MLSERVGERVEKLKANERSMQLKKPSQEKTEENLIKNLIEKHQKKSMQSRVKNCPTQVFGKKISIHNTRNKPLRATNYKTNSYMRKSSVHAAKRPHDSRLRIEIKCNLSSLNNSYI